VCGRNTAQTEKTETIFLEESQEGSKILFLYIADLLAVRTLHQTNQRAFEGHLRSLLVEKCKEDEA
jgi:hypothetical protein